MPKVIDIDLSKDMTDRLVINDAGDITAEVTNWEEPNITAWEAKTQEFMMDIRGVFHP